MSKAIYEVQRLYKLIFIVAQAAHTFLWSLIGCENPKVVCVTNDMNLSSYLKLVVCDCGIENRNWGVFKNKILHNF